MDNQTVPAPPIQQPRQSLRHRLSTTLISWGILAPPGSRETGLTESEQATRRRVFFEFRRRPGGGI